MNHEVCLFLAICRLEPHQIVLKDAETELYEVNFKAPAEIGKVTVKQEPDETDDAKGKKRRSGKDDDLTNAKNKVLLFKDRPEAE